MDTQVLHCPVKVRFLEGEYWWGGLTSDGLALPFSGETRHSTALNSDLRGNQGAPFLLSSSGRYLWSDSPFDYQIADGEIALTGSTQPVLLNEGHGHLAGAFRAAAKAHFPSAGKLPPEEFFTVPQYNTWIELNHNQTQDGVLEYAEGIIRNGLPPGVLMIDAGWSEYYGHYDFHRGRFPSPEAMMRRLRDLGFRVMLWVAPFLTADTPNFRPVRYKPHWLLRNADGTPAILDWWDGFSAHLDLSDAEAVAWLHGELRRLQHQYGVAGFKFDAGDTLFYQHHPRSVLNSTPNDITEQWARIGLEYPYNEFRACWKCGGEPIVQRLADRSPFWDHTGLASLIPNGLSLGLIGHPFLCPDMIGGGDYMHFISPKYKVDEELFVRSAQTSALFPMMQFSCAPWRVLSKEGNDLCLAAARLHQAFGAQILKEAKSSSRTGEPIMRPLEYEFPHAGYAKVTDQFMIGSNLMVAPAIVQGASKRQVVIPPGRWTDDRGTVVNGPDQIEIDVPLDRIPYWQKV